MHIVLVEPHFNGHRPNYLYIYSKSLIKLGHTVSILCSEVELCQRFINTEKQMTSVTIFPFKNEEPRNFLFPLVPFKNQYVLWKRLKRSLEDIENVDFIFFMFFDYFLFQIGSHRTRLFRALSSLFFPFLVDSFVKSKWSGLIFHPVYYLNQWNRSVFNSKRNTSICFLDETWKADFELKKRYDLPDVTDERDPVELSALALDVLKRAKGRKIIALLGSLEKRKGILPLLDIIEVSDADKYFFLMAGKLDIFYSEDEINRFKHIQNNIENSYLWLDKKLTDDDFNSLVKVSDIIYLVYIGFFSSSNLLTKASLFKKPVIVSQGYCMGKRVEKFSTGIAVPDNSMETIKRYIENFDDLFDSSKALYSEYFENHSMAKFERSLEHIFETQNK